MAASQTSAVHGITETGEHIVRIGNLRVVLLKEEGAWFAQGLEIDHVAQGSWIDEAKANFEIGLHTTIRENLTIHGTIGPVLIPAPPEVWKDLLNPAARPGRFSSLLIHPIDQSAGIGEFLPFRGINYLQMEIDA